MAERERSPTYLNLPTSVEREPRRNASTSRQSRIPVNVRDNQRKSHDSRSSSSSGIKRYPSSSHLIPPRQLRQIRSKSCVSLEKLCTTPLTATGSSGSKTPLSGSKYSSMNTDFLNSQYSRVKRYFKERNPNMPNLKPLTIGVYVETMNLLWKELDERIEINAKKPDAVSEYLKLFKFPAQIKMSVLKTPSAPHNFQYVLSIWVWLLDKIETINNLKSNLEQPSNLNQEFEYHIALKFFTGCLHNSDNPDKIKEITEEFKKNCKMYLFNMMGVEMKSFEKYQEEEIRLQQKIREAEEKNTELKKRFNSIRDMKETNKLRKNEAINKQIKLKEELEEWENKYIKCQKEKVELEEALNNQPCSFAEWKEMLEEQKLNAQKIEARIKCYNENKEWGSQVDMELTAVKCEITNLIDNINGSSLRYLQHLPGMNDFLLPNKGLLQDHMPEIITEFKEKLIELWNIKSQKQIRMVELKEKLDIEKIQLTQERKLLKEENAEQYRVINELIHTKSETYLKNLKQIEELQTFIKEGEKKKLELESYVVNMQQKLVDLQKQNEQLSKKKEMLVKEKKECIILASDFIDRFLPEMVNSNLKQVELVVEFRAKAQKIIDDIVNILDDKINHLKELNEC